MASAPRRDMLSVGEIEAMLEARLESLAFALFPNARKEGHEVRVGSLAGEPGQSLAIHVGGAKAGFIKDFSSGWGGDALKLIAAVLFRDELGPAVTWAKGWLGLDDDADPGRIDRFRAEAKAAAEKRDAEAAEKVKRTQASARKRWHMGVPIAGTMAEAYLAGRLIDLRRLGRQPGALRFNPSVQYGYGEEARLLPAMLAQVNALDGAHVATHRTWLAPDGEGGVRKAGEAEGVAKPKKVLGPFDGAHIPLWKGACGSMPLRDIPAGTDVWVSEGIEDGLTAACADPSLRVIAGISVGNIGALALPEQMGWLVILAQNDPPGSDADKALARAIAAQRARGRRVKVARPPRDAKDVNDVAKLALEAA